MGAKNAELIEKLDSIQYDEHKFELRTEDNRRVLVMAPKNSDDPAAKATTFRALYDTVMDLDWKIKASLKIAAEYIFSYDKNFEPFSPISNAEKAAIYYVENALYRNSILWDMLAQGYRVFFDVKKNKKGNPIDINHVNYKSFFDPKKTYHTKFESEADKIYQYISYEENDTKGYHGFVNDLRNEMTHKLSPNISIMSNYKMNLRCPLSIQLECIVEDYVMASKFLTDFFDMAEKSVIQSAEWDEV